MRQLPVPGIRALVLALFLPAVVACGPPADLASVLDQRDEAALRQYLEAGLDPSARLPDGRCALTRALDEGLHDIAQILLDGGADVCQETPEGRSPSRVAAAVLLLRSMGMEFPTPRLSLMRRVLKAWRRARFGEQVVEGQLAVTMAYHGIVAGQRGLQFESVVEVVSTAGRQRIFVARHETEVVGLAGWDSPGSPVTLPAGAQVRIVGHQTPHGLEVSEFEVLAGANARGATLPRTPLLDLLLSTEDLLDTQR